MKKLISFLLLAVYIPLTVLASVTVTVNGTNHTIPQTNERGWGNNVTGWIQDISADVLYPTGGNFTLGADVDWGGSFGHKSAYYKSRSSSPSDAGVLRLGNAQSVGWRNNADSGNLLLTVNSSDQLTYNGVILSGSGGASFEDATTTFYDDGDTSKVMKFQLSGITTSTTRTLTVPDADDTIVGKATTDTLTNKTLGDTNTINAQDDAFTVDDAADATLQIDFNAAGTTGTKTTITGSQTSNRVLTLPDATDTLVGKATTDTLTNKTLTSPVLNTGVSGSAVLDEDNMASDSATQLATQQSIKAYSDNTKLTLTGGTLTGDLSLDNESEIRFYESDGSGSNYSAIKAPSSLTGDTTFELPDGDGSSGQVLSTNGSGVLSWISPSSGTSSPNSLINLGFSASLSTNDLVVDLTQADGSTDPASGNGAVVVSFRDGTVTTGGFDTVSFTAAEGIQLEAQDTLGVVTGQAATVHVYLVSDTTSEICLSASLLNEDELHSATALTAGAETNETVLYCDSAHTSKPIRHIGTLQATNSGPNWGSIAEVTPRPQAIKSCIVQSPTVFTSSGTWTAADGLVYVIAEVLGGGGGGGGADGGAGSGAGCGAGGSGGGYALEYLTVSQAGTSQTVTVGAGGTAGVASGGGSGGTGGNSDFGAAPLTRGIGGNGGSGDTSPTTTNTATNTGATPASGSGGDINIQSSPGGANAIFGEAPGCRSGRGGRGAGPFGGGGGYSRVGNAAGIDGYNYGGGGSGGSVAGSSTDRAGGAGADGLVVVWECVLP